MNLGEFVYDAISYRLEIPKEEFLEALKEWTLNPIEKDGKLAAVVMVKNNEVHVAVRKGFKGKWMNRGSVIRGILAPILAEYGEIVTSVSYSNESGKAFVERLGFVPVCVLYKLEKLRHA